jgi:hypothetical protein
MLRSALIAGLAGALWSPASIAAQMCPGKAGASATLADYQKLGSCQVADKLFSKFEDKFYPTPADYRKGNSDNGAKNRLVRPLVEKFGPGLKYPREGGDWQIVNSGDKTDVIIYTVEALNGAKIDGARLSIVPVANNADVVVDETVSWAGGNVMLNAYSLQDNGRNRKEDKNVDTKTFDPVGTVTVRDFINVSIGQKGPGEAVLASFTDLFSEVPGAPMPEPSAWATMLLGLGCVGATLRSRQGLTHRRA